MSEKPYRQCKKTGCRNLVRGGGYCPDHVIIEKECRKFTFAELDKRKTPEQKAFYRSQLWTDTSRRHRAIEPLCRQCRSNGIVTAAVLVHHNPPLDELLRIGKSPYDDSVLESLCFNCHQRELSSKNVKNLR